LGLQDIYTDRSTLHFNHIYTVNVVNYSKFINIFTSISDFFLSD